MLDFYFSKERIVMYHYLLSSINKVQINKLINKYNMSDEPKISILILGNVK